MVTAKISEMHTAQISQDLFNQSHYGEVLQWEILIFMEQELRFGLDLGRLAVLKKKVWADYEQLLRVVSSCFQGQKKIVSCFTRDTSPRDISLMLSVFPGGLSKMKQMSEI